MTYMGMAGWKSDDMLDGIEGIMNLAAASGEDLATTSDIVTDALTAFGLSAEDSGHFSDVLAVAATNANTNVGMMGETFKYVAPVAGSLGYSVEDASLAIGLMANSSIKASQAGTSLRSIITRLATNAGASSTKLGAQEVLTKMLGVSFYDTAGKARDLSDVLLEAREAWKELGDEEASQYAKQIAGQEAISGWLAIMNASTEDVDKLTAALKNSKDAAKQMANTMVDNLAGDITIFKSALEGAQIVLSDKLTPYLREFVQFGTSGITQISNAFKEDGLSGAMDAFVTVLSDGLTAIKNSILEQLDGTWLGDKIDKISSFVKEKIDAGNEYFSRITEPASATLEEIKTSVLDAADRISVVLQPVSDLVSDIIDKAKEYLSSGAAMDDAVSATETGLRILSDTVAALTDGIATAFEVGADFIKWLDSGSIGANALKDAVFIVIAALVTWETVTLAVKGAQIVAALATNGMTAAMKLFNAVLNLNPVMVLVTVIGTLIAAIIYLWNTSDDFRNNVIELWDSIKNAFAVAVDAIGGFFGETLPKKFNEFLEFVRGVPSKILGFFQKLPDKFNEIGENIVKGIWNGISAMGDWIQEKVTGFFGGVVDSVKGMLGIHSPSTVFAGIGENMALGLGKGWEKAFDKVETSIDSDIDFKSYDGFGKTSIAAEQSKKDDKLYALMSDIAQNLKNMKIVLDDGAVVGAISDKIDTRLGSNYTLAKRGAFA